MQVRGPAGKQFVKPYLTATYGGLKPEAGQPFQPVSQPPYIQGIVCLPGHEPQFLLADNQPTYRSLHNFKGQTGGAIFQVGLSPLKVMPDSTAGFAFYRADQLELSSPQINHWSFATSPSWQVAPDGAIWCGLFSSFNYTPRPARSTQASTEANAAVPHYARNYALVRFNGTEWEIPFVRLASTLDHRAYYILLKGCGLPFGHQDQDTSLGTLSDSAAINIYQVAAAFAQRGSTIYPERLLQIIFNDPDFTKFVAFRTGLPSTLRADAIHWGEIDDPFLRHEPEDYLLATLRCQAECLKIDRVQYEDHFQNLVEDWQVEPDGGIKANLVGCDLSGIKGYEQNFGGVFSIPFHALAYHISQPRAATALQTSLERFTRDRIISASLYADLEYFFDGRSSLRNETRIFDLLRKLG